MPRRLQRRAVPGKAGAAAPQIAASTLPAPAPGVAATAALGEEKLYMLPEGPLGLFLFSRPDQLGGLTHVTYVEPGSAAAEGLPSAAATLAPISLRTSSKLCGTEARCAASPASTAASRLYFGSFFCLKAGWARSAVQRRGRGDGVQARMISKSKRTFARMVEIW